MPNNKKRKRNKKRTDSDSTRKESERTYIVAYATHETHNTLPVSQTSDISPSSSNTITPSLSLRTVNTVSSNLSSRTITLASTPIPSGSREIVDDYTLTKQRSPINLSPTRHSPERQSSIKYSLYEKESPTRLSPTHSPVKHERQSGESPNNYSPNKKISPTREISIKYSPIKQGSFSPKYSPTRSSLTGLSPSQYSATGISSARKLSPRTSSSKFSPTKYRSPTSLSRNVSQTKETPNKSSPTRQKSPFRKSPYSYSPVKSQSPSRKSPTRHRSFTTEGSSSNISLNHKSHSSKSPKKHSPTKYRSPTRESNYIKSLINEGSPNQSLNGKSPTKLNPIRNVSPARENSSTYKKTKYASPNNGIPTRQSTTKHRSPSKTDLIKHRNPSSESPFRQKSPRPSPSRLSPSTSIPTTSRRLSPLKIDSLQYGDVPKSSTTATANEENNTELFTYNQPFVIFDAAKKTNEHDSNKRRNKSTKHALKKKNITFKNKKSTLNSKLEKYYLKAKQSHDATAKIQKDLYSEEVSQVVSRSKVLKKVLAKENLLLFADQTTDDLTIGSSDVQEAEGYSGKGNVPNASTTSTLQTSHSSANVSRMTENSSETDEVSPSNSVINTMQAANAIPYKTEILNVGVAVTYNPTKNNNFENYNEKRENFLFTENLTSTETITGQSVPLTEESHFSRRNSPSRYVTSISLSNENVSDKTLIANEISDVWANNANKLESSAASNYTVTFNNSETVVHTENLESERTLTATDRITKPTYISQKVNNFTTTKLEIIDTLKGNGMLSSIVPTSSSTKLKGNFKSIIVAGGQSKIDDLINHQRDTSNDQMIKSNNIFKKYFETSESTGINKFNLPNEATIKLMIDEQQVKRTCAEESKTPNASATFAEMWENMVVVLDLTVKRLEDTLADKILKEIRKTFPSHEISTNQKMIDEIMGLQKRNVSSIYQNKEVLVDKSVINIDSEKSLQCNLVQNQVIDRVMLEMSMEPHMSPTLSLPAKIELHTRNRDEFHVLKPPTVPRVDEVVEVAAASVSTTYTAEASPLKKTTKIVQTLKEIAKDPMKFLSENAIVIATVPAFFLMFFLIYLFIALTIQ